MPREPEVVTQGPLMLSYQRDSGVSQISLSGEFDLSCAKLVDETMTRALRSHRESVIVDLSGLQFIDSTGIAVLVRAIKKDARFRRLRFVPSPSPSVSRVLDITGVSELMRFERGASPDGG